VAAEIERRFLPPEPPSSWPLQVVAESVVEISQGYLTKPGSDPEIRLRKAREVEGAGGGEALPSKLGPHGVNGVRKLAIKSASIMEGDSNLVRREIEIDLEHDDFDEAWLLTAGRRLKKLRRSVTLRLDEGLLGVLVDEFWGPLRGLRIAEIEFDDLHAARKFSPPDFLGPEVTADIRYRNSELVGATAPPQQD
jgi:adenylate cyclase